MSNFIRRNAPLIAAGVFAVAVFGLGTQGKGPLGTVGPIRNLGVGTEADAPSPTTTTTVGPGGTTTTTITLGAMDYAAGACIIWDQSDARSSERRTREVPCDEPHLFEVVTDFEIDGSGYGDDGPTNDEWKAVTDTQCAPRTTDYLGYPIDPAGRFFPNVISPTPAGWRLGDRTIWCGIVTRSETDQSNHIHPEFTGVVKGADQTWLIPVGTCFGAQPGDSAPPRVPCDGPHYSELIGTVDIDGGDGSYPGQDAITQQGWELCKPVADATYGGVRGPDVTIAIYGIEESSWAAGRRTVECTLGRVDASGQLIESPGLIRAN